VFDSRFFIDNRHKLRELFGGTAPIVIAGSSLIQKNVDAKYPFAQDSNFWYLTGLNEPGLILVMESEKEYIILPKSDEHRDIFDGATDTTNLSKISGIKDIYDNKEGHRQLSRKLIKSKHAATIQPAPSYIDEMVMFTNPSKKQLLKIIKENNPDINLIDLRSIFANMRSVKQTIELKALNQALKYTKDIYKALEELRHNAKYEYELMAEAEKQTRLLSAEFGYEPIIASGQNAITLHYIANDSKIDRESFLLVDLGLRHSNYSADITRTVVDTPTKRQTKVYEAVMAVHEFALSVLQPGTDLKTYETAVHHFMGEKLRELGLIKSISDESVQTYYPHATSHFLGIDVHDVGDREKPLVSGMVLTVEPGIYIMEEGIGIRLEDMVLITEQGNKILSADMEKHINKLV